MRKWVYTFGGGQAEGSAQLRDLLGGKGANLAEMSRLGLPVPPGFTVSTEVCSWFYQHRGSYPDGLKEQVLSAIAQLGQQLGRGFGNEKKPLLVSVRSGARVSMPGMMDTILNLGLNDASVGGLIAETGNARFAWDSYRRFIQMYSDVVLGVNSELFEHAIAQLRDREQVATDAELSAPGLKELVSEYKRIVARQLGKEFPQDVMEQLWGCVGAVFRSWETPRAKVYRRLHQYSDDWGTATTVQAMVFGNMGEDSATGVAFTRNPSNGENYFYGEYLCNAQGEDVVAGIRTPQPISRAEGGQESLEARFPAAYQQLLTLRSRLEQHYRDMQDIEFTIQQGTLYLLQTRSGKRTAQAALQIACDLVDEGMIDQRRALQSIDAERLEDVLHPIIDPMAAIKVLATGLPASPGVAVGQIVFSADEAVELAQEGRKVLLVVTDTSPEDIHGMSVAEGILTARGGMTSHAAVVARGMGKPCVCGVTALSVDRKRGVCLIAGLELKGGQWLTIDGTRGQVIAGKTPTIQPSLTGAFGRVMDWVDNFQQLEVWGNADTPEDAAVALRFGAKGIGLCRTEHMFFGVERILRVRQMILSQSVEERREALSHLLPMQRADFLGIFRTMKHLPVTIRLLDPPLHEFLPRGEAEIEEVAKFMSLTRAEVQQRIAMLHEANPMLGHRGCRLLISYPEITEMQSRAIFEAMAELQQERFDCDCHIMVPLVGHRSELDAVKQVVDDTAATVMAEKSLRFTYHVGTMIEIPRAALQAAEIAQTADFFSFGTNDLTQTTLGLSRDDSSSWFADYISKGIVKRDPFQSLDTLGVGELVRIGVERGRQTKPSLPVGVCGEHGGDPASIRFFESVGLDYVSCSPWRVPIARLTAAQCAIKTEAVLAD